MGRPLLFTLIVAGMLSTAVDAHARPVRGIAIDADIKTSAAVVIGKVDSVRVVTARTPGPFRSQVEIQEFSVRAVVAFTGIKRGARFKLRHPRVLPSNQPVINGFGPPVIQPGAAYVLFLDNKPGGHFELVAVEATLPKIGKAAVRKLTRKRLAGTPIERLVTALTISTAACTRDCGPAIWMVSGSQVLRKQLATRAGRKRHVAALIRIAKNPRADYNSKIAAFTALGRLRVNRALPVIISIATQKPPGGKVILSNTISFLQGFDEATQMKNLRIIIKQARDPGVIDRARARLKYLESRKP